MKDLPEVDFWSLIRSRLKNYEEEPDDDWDKIAAAIPTASGTVVGFNRMSDTVVLVLLAFLFGFHFGKTLEIQPDNRLTTSLEAKEHSSEDGVNRLIPDLTSTVDSTSRINNPLAIGISDRENTTATRQENSNASRYLNSRPSRKFEDGKLTTTNVNVSFNERQDRSFKSNHPSGTDAVKANASNESINNVINTSEKYNDGDALVRKLSDENIPAIIPNTAESTEYITKKSEGDTAPISKDSASSNLKDKKKEEVMVASPVRVILPQKRAKKFLPSVFVSVAPSLAYQKIVPSTDDDINITRLNSAGIFSANRLGVNISGGLQVQVSSKIELLLAGSYYTQKPSVSYSYTASDELSLVEGDDEWSFTLSPDVNTKRFTYKMKNLGVCAGLLYHIHGGKLMHKIGGSLFYERGMVKPLAEESYANSASTYFGYQLLYRMEFALNQRTSIFAQPAFTRSILAKEMLDEPFEMKPYRAGVGFGVVYHF